MFSAKFKLEQCIPPCITHACREYGRGSKKPMTLWCNGPVEGGTLCLRVDDGTSDRNVDDDALSSEWPVDAALLTG